MTVKQTGIVDWLGLEKGTGDVLLTLIDDLDWSSEHDHLLALQDKLNTYLAFIESGEVFERLRAEVGRQVARDTPVKVSILGRHQPTPHAQAFLEHARVAFEQAGFTLAHKVVEV